MVSYIKGPVVVYDIYFVIRKLKNNSKIQYISTKPDACPIVFIPAAQILLDSLTTWLFNLNKILWFP